LFACVQAFNISLSTALPDSTSTMRCGVSALSADQMAFVYQALTGIVPGSMSSTATGPLNATAVALANQMLSAYAASWSPVTRVLTEGSLFTWFQSSSAEGLELSATVSAAVCCLDTCFLIVLFRFFVVSLYNVLIIPLCFL
jgi:hypothetical protein